MTGPIVVVAGSRALKPGLAPRLLVRFLAELPPASTILLRRGRFRSPNLFEAQVEQVCDLLGLDVEWCFPEAKEGPAWDPKSSARVGRQQTFDRDMEMVARAELVLCFWPHEETGDETRGTVSLANKAVDLNKVVYAYAIVDENLVERVGEHDPTNAWETRVPAPA